MKTKLLFSVFILSTLFLSAQSYILNDGFEDGVLGTLPTGWIIKYNGTGTANQKLVDDPVKTGTKSFQLEGQSSWTSDIYQIINNLPDLVTAEAWVFPEKILGGVSGGFGFANYNAGTWGTRTAFVYFLGDRIVTSNFSGPNYDLQSYTPETWYHFKIELNITSKTYKVYINDVQMSNTMGTTTISEFPMHPSISTIHVGLLAGNSDTVKMWFDDVKVYETSNLVAYYPFNGNANDESGNANHGTIDGATLTVDRFGNPDSAYSFDGNDVISIAHNNPLNMDNELSMSVWIKPNSTQNAMILGKSNYSNATNYVLRTQSNDFIEYAHKTRNFSNNNPLNIGAWNHIAVVSHLTGEREIYINNNLTTFTSQPDAYGIVSNLISIGAAYYFGSYFAEFFNGSIDDLRIYKSALTASNVSSLYNNNSLDITNKPSQETTSVYIYNKCIYFKNTQNLSKIKSIAVFNLLAQKVYHSNTVQNENPLPLKQGIYILKVEYTNNHFSTLKFIIK